MKKSKKKSLKAKKNNINNKDSKVKKKKINKKTTTHKKEKKKSTANKKTTTYKKKKKKSTTNKKTINRKKNIKKKNIKVFRKKIEMKDVYSIVNNAQMGKKEIVFSSDFDNYCVIENILKDSEVKYIKKELKTKVVFTLFPSGKEEKEDVLLEKIELYEDEFPEEDLLF